MAMLSLKTTAKRFGAVQIEPSIRTHVVLFVPLLQVSGAIYLLPRGHLTDQPNNPDSWKVSIRIVSASMTYGSLIPAADVNDCVLHVAGVNSHNR